MARPYEVRFEPQKSGTFVYPPPVPNVVSSEPVALKRETQNSYPNDDELSRHPPRTYPPDASTATSAAIASLPNAAVALPSVSNVLSNDPSAFSRVSMT